MTGIDGMTFEEAWPDRLEREIDGLTIPVISRAALLRNKRAAGRVRDLADVRWLIESSGGEST